MSDRDPLNPEAEELAVLHAAFHQGTWLDTLKLTAADFYSPLTGQMWEVLGSLHADHIAPDPSTIAARWAKSGIPSHELHSLLLAVVDDPSIPANAEHHAAIVADRAIRRQLNATTVGARQRINDLSQPVDEAVAYVERELIGSSSGADRECEKLWTYDEFVGQPLGSIDWVIPELLAREDRIVLTGSEGAGKTTLMRTIGVMVAAGLHPFTLHPIPAKRVLFVDCENPNRIMVQRFADLGQIAKRRGLAPKGLHIRRFPQGIDLGKPADRMKLRYLCQAIQPELLLIGPAYKMYMGGSNAREEDLARIVASALDGLREEFGFALILEHHVPKGMAGGERSLAPIGSSLWMRWPEFGLGLKLDATSSFTDRRADLIHWRGARDERPWPGSLVSGGLGGLPWVDSHSLVRSA